jgi:hypothetical protein
MISKRLIIGSNCRTFVMKYAKLNTQPNRKGGLVPVGGIRIQYSAMACFPGPLISHARSLLPDYSVIEDRVTLEIFARPGIYPTSCRDDQLPLSPTEFKSMESPPLALQKRISQKIYSPSQSIKHANALAKPPLCLGSHPFRLTPGNTFGTNSSIFPPVHTIVREDGFFRSARTVIAVRVKHSSLRKGGSTSTRSIFPRNLGGNLRGVL